MLRNHDLLGSKCRDLRLAEDKLRISLRHLILQSHHGNHHELRSLDMVLISLQVLGLDGRWEHLLESVVGTGSPTLDKVLGVLTCHLVDSLR